MAAAKKRDVRRSVQQTGWVTLEGGFAARSDIAAPAGSPALSSLKILPVDYDYTEKEAPRIKKRFNEIFQ